MLAHINTWCVKDIRTKYGPEKKLRALNLLIPGAQMTLEIWAYFDPWSHLPKGNGQKPAVIARGAPQLI